MQPSAELPEPAYQGEMFLAAWSEASTTGVKVSFILPDKEALDKFRFLTVRKGKTAGQRFKASFVRVNKTEPAYAGELMLAGWDEKHNRGPLVTFMLPDDEALRRFKYFDCHKPGVTGERFMAVLIQIDDDEQPIPPGGDTQKAKLPSNAAALMCLSDGFQQFVQHKRNFVPDKPHEREEQAVVYMREFCGMKSRKELDHQPEKRDRYKVLMAELRAFHGGE